MTLERDSQPDVVHLPPKLLIIEGILILNIKELSAMFDRRYYFTLTYEECRRRRLTRTYDPSDVPGYFDMIVWPMHVKLAAELRKEYEDIGVCTLFFVSIFPKSSEM